MEYLPLIVLICVLGITVHYVKKKAKRDRIYRKYGKNETAEKILKKIIWVGETSEQLRDSLGSPIDIDEKVLKTKRKETWKCCRKTSRSFGLKIFVEDSAVVGWDEKL